MSLTSTNPLHLPPGPFQWTQDQLDRAKSEMRSVLLNRARNNNVISYSELTEAIHAIQFDPNDQRFHAALGEISYEEHLAGRGMLSALVVHKQDKRPGDGFDKLARNLGRKGDALSIWSGECTRLYSEQAARSTS